MKMPSFKNIPNEFRRDAVATGKILAPPAFVIAAGIGFHDFVIHAVMANVVINAGIMLTAVYGIWLILSRLFQAQGDFQIIERFGREASQGEPMDQLLGELWLKRKYVRHYLAHIARTGGTISSQLDQNAIENELQALSGEYESRLELPQFLVGFMIALGLLGTFIGLLTTLTGVAGMLDALGGSEDIQAQFARLVGDLRKPLAGMGIAFSASMFGLVCSLMLSIMMTNLRRYINRVLALARNVMHDLVQLSRPAIPGLTPLHGVSAGAVVSAASGEMVMVASRLDLLIKKIEMLMQTVETSAAGTEKLNGLLGFGPRMKEISERTLEEIKSIGLGNAEQQQLTHKLIDVNGDMARVLSNVLDVQRAAKDTGDKSLEAIKGVSAAQAEQARLSQKMMDVYKETSMFVSGVTEEQGRKLIEAVAGTGILLNGMVEAQRQTKEVGEKSVEGLRALAAEQTTQGRMLQKMHELSGEIIRIAEMALEAQRQQGALEEAGLAELKSIAIIAGDQRQLGQVSVEGLEHIARTGDNSFTMKKSTSAEMLGALRTLEERMSRVEEAEIGGSRHLFAIKESLTKLGQTLGVVDLVSTGIGQHTLLLEAMVEEVRASRIVLFGMQQQSRQGNAQTGGEES